MSERASKQVSKPLAGLVLASRPAAADKRPTATSPATGLPDRPGKRQKCWRPLTCGRKALYPAEASRQSDALARDRRAREAERAGQGPVSPLPCLRWGRKLRRAWGHLRAASQVMAATKGKRADGLARLSGWLNERADERRSSINRYRDTYLPFANTAPRSPRSSTYGGRRYRRPADFPLAEGRGALSRVHFR